jgi:hypothetical protein
VLQAGHILQQTSDGGANWRPIHRFGDDISYLWSSRDMKRIVAAGFDEKLATVHVYRSDTAGGTWRDLPIRTLAHASDVIFGPDLLRGWVSGDETGFLDTFDGGVSWSRSSVAGPTPMASTIRFAADGKHVFALTDFGVPLRSDNGGDTWSAPSPSRYPAPWFWLVFLLLTPVIVFATRGDSAQPSGDVSEIPVNDAPLRSQLDDVLQFAPTANGITRFLANDSTKPPLTIAITGAWGKGKSSLINLVLEGVRRYGHRPVLFNAWH